MPGYGVHDRQMGTATGSLDHGSSGRAGGADRVVPAKVRAPRLRWLPRERLDQLLGQVWEHRLCLVTAPAGSGKTTLLAGWAGIADCPVAWYRAESTDGAERSLVACLEAALGAAIPTLGTGWTTVEDAVAALEAWDGPRVLLIVDDLHALTGTPAVAALERFLDYAPPSLAIVAGSRTAPAFNLPRRRVSGGLMEITGDDLRFRSWEVERLFRDFYDEALRPDELARLARRTEGWAAGLQLFHLATRGKPPDERSRILVGLGSSSRFVRDYLARNVVEELPDELREFLVGTSVLRRLSGPLCDALLGRTGSRALLEELERRSVFTVALDDEGTFRYHEVLRSHLEAMLVESIGEPQARAHARRAGALLEARGALAEALAAYSRGEDWAAVDRLVAAHGEQLVAGDGAWIDTLPPALLVQDPWLILASARRHRAEGRWNQAVDAYGRAEALFPAGEAGAVCRAERVGLAAWLDPLPAPGSDWTGALRAAVARDPLARRSGGPAALVAGGGGPADRAGDRLAVGLAALAAGRVREARLLLRDASEADDATATLAAAACLAGAIAGILAGDARATVEAEGAVAAAERIGAGWLARVGRAALAIARTPAGSEYGRADAAAVRATAAREEDRWGEGLAALAEGWAALGEPDLAVAPLEVAVTRFRALGAGALESWARALLAGAIGRSGGVDAREAAIGAEAFARAVGTPGPHALAHLALAESDPVHGAELRAIGEALLDETGLALPAGLASPAPAPVPAGSDAAAGPSDPRDPGGPALVVTCFGAFSLALAGRPVDLAALKPRPRAVLRLLALQAGRPVHREVIQEALWPDADPETGARSLHVALSAVRRELEAAAGAAASSLLVRDGDAYRLAMPAGSHVDLADFESAIVEARSAQARGDRRAAIAAYRRAVASFTGELLPEDGPADWVVARRERARADFVDASRALAELLLDDEPAEAATTCTAALGVDPYHDPLWQILVDAREQSGDRAAASSARAGYARMLAELGVAAGDRPG